jgi:AcrR family transcriptional regulator
MNVKQRQKADAEDSSRRNTGTRTRGRAARVVEDVLRATGEELCRVGYAAMRIEDVAASSGVNKTTIYRRWPSKVDLVSAAIQQFKDHTTFIDTGSVRQDLRESLVTLLDLNKDRKWQGIIQMISSHTDPEVNALSDKLRDEQHAKRVAMIERGIARGELPPTTDTSLIADMVIGAVVRRLLSFRQTIDESYVDAVLDVVLTGANALEPSARKPARSPAVAARTQSLALKKKHRARTK